MIQAIVLFVNSIAVLNEERFLRRIGLGDKSNFERSTIQLQLVNILRSVRTILTIPLLFMNLFTIIIVLIFG